MTDELRVVECRGMQCPGPVLATARAARGLSAGGVLEIYADDDAFPSDLKSWCRSANADLESIDVTDGAYRARVRVARRAEAEAPAPQPAAAQAGVRAADSGSSAAQAERLDCRGKQCPEPVLMLARFARERPGALLEVLATDAAFPSDLKSWCRASGAELVTIDEGADSTIRAVVRAGRGAATVAPAPQRAPTASAPPSAPAPAAPATTNLVYVPHEKLDAELTRAAERAPAGQSHAFEVASVEAAQAVVRWCASQGHALRALRSGDPTVVEVTFGAAPKLAVSAHPASGALALRPADAPDVSLLVLHNSFESLLAAMMVATTAAAQGQRVLVFFTFWGLNVLRGDRRNPAAPRERVGLLQRIFKWLMPRGPRRQRLSSLDFGGAGTSIMRSIMREKNVSDLPELLRSAEELGVEFVACTTSMTVMGITQGDLFEYRHLSYAGAATFVERSRHAALSLTF